MVLVSVLATNNMCASFTHNPLKRAQGKPAQLSLMVIHKECTANVRTFESYFIGGRHGCACVAMGDHHYALQSQITFVPPRRPGLSTAYPINQTHGNIAVADQKFQNNHHEYHLVKILTLPWRKSSLQPSTASGWRGRRIWWWGTPTSLSSNWWNVSS